MEVKHCGDVMVPNAFKSLEGLAVTKAESGDENGNDEIVPNDMACKFDAGGLCSDGLEMLKMKRWAEAAAIFTEALSIKPEDPLLHLHRALANLRLKNFQDAEADCTETLVSKPNLIKAYLRRSESRKPQGKFIQAALDLVKVMELQREFELPMSVTRGEYDDLVFLTVDELYHKEKAVLWAQNEELSRKEEYFGALLMKQQRWSEAIVKLTNAIKLTRGRRHPRLTDLFSCRGNCWKSLGQSKYIFAEADYTSAISIDDKNSTLYYERSLVRSDMGNNTGALEDLIRMQVSTLNLNPLPSSILERYKKLASEGTQHRLAAAIKEKMCAQRRLDLEERRRKLEEATEPCGGVLLIPGLVPASELMKDEENHGETETNNDGLEPVEDLIDEQDSDIGFSFDDVPLVFREKDFEEESDMISTTEDENETD